MKTRIRLVLIALTIGLVLAFGAGCAILPARSVPPTLTATLAPTAVPLPTATPTPPATSPATAAPTATSQPQPTATASPPPPPTEVVPPEDEIRLPAGFGISLFVSGLNDPRMMTVGPEGALYVAERGAGRIVRLPDADGNGVADGVEIVADGLSAPSSIDFHPDGSLYVGETTRILRLRDPDLDDKGRFQEREVVIDGLPSGGHNTRTVLISPEGEHLFVSIGSSCNVCIEEDERRATIMRYAPDGSEGMIYAEGLRNAVGITVRPGADELWATNNGRDWLGDNQPPETIYHIQQGDDAGWPRCHAARIVDPEFGEPGACEGVAEPEVEMQAHSAPLGLTFYTGDQFPANYRGDMFVAFHGSWNRSTPTGYKVIRIPVDQDQGTPGTVRDFAVGWLREDGSDWGRPVDVVTGADGCLFISDDAGGKIYRVFYAGE